MVTIRPGISLLASRGDASAAALPPSRVVLALAVSFAAALVSLSSVRGQDDDLVELEDAAVKAAVARTADCVVSIETIGGLEKVGGVLVGTGPTTGLVVSEDGYIVSSAFNFIQKPSTVLVTLPGGKRTTAEIVARDHSRMLVLLKVQTDEPLAVPTHVPRDEMQVGQWSIAVGRTFEQDEPNVSVGVISATNRIWGKAVQTDAKVSPNNYGGPLLDIHGRVLGLLVPLSPQGGSEVAGAEWYDSGIGFAVPLVDLSDQLERMKQGQDLFPGILGVTLKPGDMYVDPAEVAAAPANSPAAKAGIQPSDVIAEVDGVAVATQVQLRHELGHRYAGEVLSVVVRRGEERLELNIELAEKLEPYQQGFLGVLPLRVPPGNEPGVVIRYVYPGSPADDAGIAVGDRLVAIDGREIADAASLLEAMAAYEAGAPAVLDVRRGEESLPMKLTLAALPVDIPALLPPAHPKPAAEDAARPAVGWIEVKLPEESNDCFAYVPATYHGDVPCGVVVWLAPPGDFDKDALLARWKDRCDASDLILLVPRPSDPSRWLPTEVAFVRKVLDNVLAGYHVDSTRVVVHGHRAGGAMAYLVALANRDVVRGVAVIDAPIPARAQPPENDAVQRLAVYSAAAEESRLGEQIAATIKLLTDRKFPVTQRDLGKEPRYLDAAELDELVRWIDSLDRL